ncbi:MAG: hypothetical protein A2451_16295 [Bdellovibrionales bacterium RIFOXYC2_FULL_39_8]|nr:MAG: hypothetical protein A2451_16295 [Bdellovibrionales bacterium RIFOXYC2_FULL_39_8]
MSKGRNTILYIGNDQIFLDDLMAFDKVFWPQNTSEVVQLPITREWLQGAHGQIFTRMPQLVFIDFSDGANFKMLNPQFYDLLNFVKKHPLLKRTPICGTFISEEQLAENRNLFASGLSYAYIKGDLYTTLFEDSYYLAFEDKIAFPRYAMASEINLDYQLKMPVVVKNMNADKIVIESDISFREDEEVEGSFNFFEDFSGKKFTVARHTSLSSRNFYLCGQELFIKYAEPWDEVTEDSFVKETVETWVEFNKGRYAKLFPAILLVNDDNLFIYDLTVSGLSGKCDLCFSYELENQFLQVKNNRPTIIMLELDESEMTDEMLATKYRGRKDYLRSNTDALMMLTSFIKTLEYYNPILVLFNSPSKSEAIRKVCGYNSILAHNEKMSTAVIGELISFYQANKKSSVDDDSLSIPLASQKSMAAINIPVKITGLTEHEITFLSSYSLPLFSILKLDEPFEMYLTIMPSIRDLKIVPGFHHYMAFISGTSETRLPILRQFITQLIDHPPKEFKFYPNEVTEVDKEIEGKEIIIEKKEKKVKVERMAVQWVRDEKVKSKL